MGDSKIKRYIFTSAYFIILVLIIAVIALIMLKYNIEGEKNIPFKISNILLVSSAEGYQQERNKDYIWDTEIYQYNDIYLNIEKNKNYKETEIIKSIEIENIKIDKAPTVGKIKVYRASGKEQNLFEYKEEYEITDKIEYIGDVKTDLSNLTIANQGGTIIIKVVNKTGERYTSNEKEFEHSGKLLEKVGMSYNNIKFSIFFDLIINLESDISFKTQIKLDLPTGDIIEGGISNSQINNVIFKREQ